MRGIPIKFFLLFAILYSHVAWGDVRLWIKPVTLALPQGAPKGFKSISERSLRQGFEVFVAWENESDRQQLIRDYKTLSPDIESLTQAVPVSQALRGVRLQSLLNDFVSYQAGQYSAEYGMDDRPIPRPNCFHCVMASHDPKPPPAHVGYQRFKRWLGERLTELHPREAMRPGDVLQWTKMGSEHAAVFIGVVSAGRFLRRSTPIFFSKNGESWRAPYLFVSQKQLEKLYGRHNRSQKLWRASSQCRGLFSR